MIPNDRIFIFFILADFFSDFYYNKHSYQKKMLFL